MNRILLLVLALFFVACTQKPAQSIPETDQVDQYAFANLPALKPGEAVASFGGGCFWAMEEVFEEIKGVRAAISGYAGGTLPNPTYEQVSTDETGHAEAVQVYYDPKVITYDQLLDVFFAGHDGTQLNRQGPDVGRHYRSVAFYRTPAEKVGIEAAIRREVASGHHADPIVTTVEPIPAFYPAENYHQEYCKIHPDELYIRSVSLPKVEKMRKAMAGKLKTDVMAI
ncbi:MAG: peptide-methionine (S)-S-oxide reductase MsrA [Bacteroidetes bacterium]|nr:peptide-methionine (S)-S-oxide reductase MsrA [Fibrella sp.]